MNNTQNMEPLLAPPYVPAVKSAGILHQAWQRLLSDRLGLCSLVVVLLSLLLVLGTSLGWLAADWNEEVALSHATPVWWGQDSSQVAPRSSSEKPRQAEPATPSEIQDPIAAEMAHVQALLADQVSPESRELDKTRPMGADKWGRDVLKKTLKGAEVSISVGLSAALMATLIGALLGAVSGWFGGWFDDLSNWVYNVFHSIPSILLILAFAAVLDSRGTLSVVIILGLTGWTGIYRLVRAEYLKHRNRDYVRAADALGASHMRRIFVHVLPNVSHVILVQFSLLTVSCIKAEVILSFLGFGVPVDGVSWGTMLTEAQNDLLIGQWWQLLSATLAMSIFVTALSLLTDSARDALDPKFIQTEVKP